MTEKKENVCVGNFPTGQSEDGMDGGMDARQKESLTVLGKFKSVDALIRAYETLQSEFTRRSQRLKELERKMENSEGQAEREQTDGSGAEKLRKNATARRAQTKAFDAFVAEVAESSEKRQSVSEEPVLGGSESLTAVESAQGEKVGKTAYGVGKEEKTEGLELQEKDTTQVRGLELDGANLAREKEESIKNGEVKKGGKPTLFEQEKEGENFRLDELYNQVIANEGVRLRIIGEYLTSLQKSAVPLTAQIGGAFRSPPIKATSIADAGDMALRYLKNSKSGK